VEIRSKTAKNEKFMKIKVNGEEIWNNIRKFGRMEGKFELLKLRV